MFFCLFRALFATFFKVKKGKGSILMIEGPIDEKFSNLSELKDVPIGRINFAENAGPY